MRSVQGMLVRSVGSVVTKIVAAVVMCVVGVVSVGAPGVEVLDVGVAAADTVDGRFDGVGRLQGGQNYDLEVLGRGGVPASGVDSVALNVTVTRPSPVAYLTVWPTGEARPTASNLNFVRGQTVPNAVVVRVGAGGSVSFFSNGAGGLDVVVDVLGWFPTGGGFVGVSPARLMDTRAEGVTIDGVSAAAGAVAGGSTRDLAVAGRAGVPASGAGSVVLNVTVTNPTADAFVTVWPAGVDRPNASNVNVTAGATVPNLVIVPLGVGGRVSLFVNAGVVDVVVDVLGWFPTGEAFLGLTPARVLDTRPDGVTVDGRFAAGGSVAGGESRSVVLAGRGGVPVAGGGSVALNVTVTNATARAFVTAWPTGAARPTASNLNVEAGRTVANLVLVPLGADGAVSSFVNAGTADVVVDVLGWFPADGAFRGVTPSRLMDTRSAVAGLVPILDGTFSRSMVSDGESIWIPDDLGLTRFHIGSEVSERVVLPGFGYGGDLMFDGEFLWLTRFDEVGRLDPRTGALTVFGPTWDANGPTTPVALGQHVWTMNRGSNSLSRIDRRTGAVRVFRLPDWTAGASGLTTDGRFLWFPSAYENAFFRFDPATRAIATYPLSTGLAGPLFAEFDGRRVWTSREVRDGTAERYALTWVDVTTGASGDVTLANGFGSTMDLASDGRSVWVSHEDRSHVTEVDAVTGAVTVHPMVSDTFAPNLGLWWFGSVAVDDEAVWLGTTGALSYLRKGS